MSTTREERALAARLENLWHEGIPLAQTMQVSVIQCDDHGLTVAAPLTPNSNHMGTVFGGSLVSLATLAGWGVVYGLLDAPEQFDIVVQRVSVRFLKPGHADFSAFCPMPDPDIVKRFQKQTRRRGRARLGLSVLLSEGQVLIAEFDGHFVATRA